MTSLTRIKFRTVEDFENYPHDKIISSSGFKHDPVDPEIDHVKIFEDKMKPILVKEIGIIAKDLLEDGCDSKTLLSMMDQFTGVLKLMNEDNWKMHDFYEIQSLSTDVYDELLEEEIRLQAEEHNPPGAYGDGDIDESSYLTTMIGPHKYELSIVNIRDSEGSAYKEEWKKDGDYHRYGGEPALKEKTLHNIPEEVYLDEGTNSYYLDGKLIKSEDSLSKGQQREVEIHSMLGLGTSREDLINEHGM